MARKSRISKKQLILAPPFHKIYHTGLYVRLSILNGGKKDSDTAKTQESILRNFIRGKSEFSLFSVYIDNGETGVDFERDEFERLIGDVRTGRVDCIIVKDLSRFGRNYIEAGEYLEKIFPFIGVRFIAINDQYDSIDPFASDILSMHLKNLVNDIYARDISRKVCPVLRSKQEKGKFIGAWAPYGYRKSETDRHQLVIDEKVAPVVREMYQWRYEGWTYSDIVHELRERNIPSPSRYRYEEGIIKDKNLGKAIWKITTVQRILSRQVYIGHLVQGQKQSALWKGQKQTVLPEDEWIVIPNTHRAIVDKEIFLAVQKINGQRAGRAKSSQGCFEKIEDTENIMEGLAVCGHCGKRMIRYRSVRKYKSRPFENKVWHSYYCSAHRVSSELCPSTGIPEIRLLSTVCAVLNQQFLLAESSHDCIKTSIYHHMTLAESYKLTKDIEHLKSEIECIKRHEEALYEDYAEHLMSGHDYVYAKERYREKREKCRQAIEELNGQIKIFRKEKKDEKPCLKTAMSFFIEPRLTRAVTEALVERVIVHSGKRIEIRLRFDDEYKKLPDYWTPYWKGAANG